MGAKYKDGEYLSLYWEDYPEEAYVKGHMTPEEFIKSVNDYHGTALAPIPVTHNYGRWSMQTGYDGPSHMLATYAEPGPGRFKLTTVRYRDLFPPAACHICGNEVYGEWFREDEKPVHRRCANPPLVVQPARHIEWVQDWPAPTA